VDLERNSDLVPALRHQVAGSCERVSRKVIRMRRDELAQAAGPDAIVARVTEPGAELPRQDQGHDHGHGMPTESTREATYRGHHIVIHTTYRIEVDGMPIEGHLGVTNDGQVHYHAVPNLSFASAVDLVKQLIDTFPDDFQAATDAHTHGHGQGS
jgi:hypothetical protein